MAGLLKIVLLAVAMLTAAVRTDQGSLRGRFRRVGTLRPAQQLQPWHKRLRTVQARKRPVHLCPFKEKGPNRRCALNRRRGEYPYLATVKVFRARSCKSHRVTFISRYHAVTLVDQD